MMIMINFFVISCAASLDDFDLLSKVELLLEHGSNFGQMS